MSTGLQTKISIQIDGNEVEVKEIDETVSSVTIGSGSDAAICIDVPGVDEMHAFLSFEGGIPMLGDLAGQITVNGNPLDPNQPLKSGDSIQIANVTLVLDITDTRAEDATDPRIEAVTVPDLANPPVQEYYDDEEESEEYETEFGLDGLVESMLENTVDSGKAKTKLAVHQVYGTDIIAMKTFGPSEEEITMSSEIGSRFRFIGKSVAWVPRVFGSMSWVMYPFTETKLEWKRDFYGLNENAETIFKWNGDKPVCVINKNWNAFVFTQDGNTSLEGLREMGKVQESGDSYLYELEENGGIILETGALTFVANRVPEAQKITGGVASDIDYPFASLMTVLLLLCSFLTYYILFIAPPAVLTDTSDQDELMADLLLEEAPEPPPDEDKPDANPDAGEGAKAKKEEGKVGKKDAKMKEAKGDKVEVDKRTKDKEVVDEFMSGLNFGAESDSGANDGMGGIANLDANMQGGLGGVLGAKGVQAGSGGLGSSGGGLGGGGTADGVGGLGTKGSGKGSSGYGKGGGSVGKKRSGGSIKSGGTPIILGALDKSLIDAVIKRNMSQIRYCYQRELTKNPTLKGKIIVKFTIAGDGSVSKAGIKSSSMGSSSVESCIAGRFKRFKFPEPKGGGVVIVSYPFIFSS
jgi:outer membrane biosynthesis protein TonB